MPSIAPCLGANPEYKGDGYCDDDLNNEACEFDEGDCCLENVNTQFCTDCECIEPEEGKGFFTFQKNKTFTCDLTKNYI